MKTFHYLQEVIVKNESGNTNSRILAIVERKEESETSFEDKVISAIPLHTSLRNEVPTPGLQYDFGSTQKLQIPVDVNTIDAAIDYAVANIYSDYYGPIINLLYSLNDEMKIRVLSRVRTAEMAERFCYIAKFDYLPGNMRFDTLYENRAFVYLLYHNFIPLKTFIAYMDIDKLHKMLREMHSVTYPEIILTKVHNDYIKPCLKFYTEGMRYVDYMEVYDCGQYDRKVIYCDGIYQIGCFEGTYEEAKLSILKKYEEPEAEAYLAKLNRARNTSIKVIGKYKFKYSYGPKLNTEFTPYKYLQPVYYTTSDIKKVGINSAYSLYLMSIFQGLSYTDLVMLLPDRALIAKLPSYMSHVSEVDTEAIEAIADKIAKIDIRTMELTNLLRSSTIEKFPIIRKILKTKLAQQVTQATYIDEE